MKCSPEVTIFLDNYKKNREIALNSAQEKSYEFLLKNFIDDAIKEFLSYKNDYTTDRYETNSITSWHLHVEMINYIVSSSPKVLGSISNSNLSNLRAAVCMSILWVNELPESWLPDDFETTLSSNAVAVNYLKCNARIKRDLDKCQEYSQKVKLVFDKFDLDSCESCKKLKNKIFYIKDFPELPLESCTSQTGCKCEIEGFYDEIGRVEEEEKIHNYIMKVVSSRKDEFNEPYVLEKLKALKNFFDDNLITEEEFKRKRAEIIQKYF